MGEIQFSHSQDCHCWKIDFQEWLSTSFAQNSYWRNFWGTQHFFVQIFCIMLHHLLYHLIHNFSLSLVIVIESHLSPITMSWFPSSKVILKPTCLSVKQPEWFRMQNAKGVTDDLRIRIAIRMDKPVNLKYCGQCWVLGKSSFKKWKRRYLCLIQVRAKQLLFIYTAISLIYILDLYENQKEVTEEKIFWPFSL